mmetsp:Transcript_27335/g.68471  ORF Transcript_27335/g.68471 Transcript_27335/m.68471 type:complete len:121 (+) Transcript_27335:563-925(+)
MTRQELVMTMFKLMVLGIGPFSVKLHLTDEFGTESISGFPKQLLLFRQCLGDPTPHTNAKGVEPTPPLLWRRVKVNTAAPLATHTDNANHAKVEETTLCSTCQGKSKVNSSQPAPRPKWA